MTTTGSANPAIIGIYGRRRWGLALFAFVRVGWGLELYNATTTILPCCKTVVVRVCAHAYYVCRTYAPPHARYVHDTRRACDYCTSASSSSSKRSAQAAPFYPHFTPDLCTRYQVLLVPGIPFTRSLRVGSRKSAKSTRVAQRGKKEL